MKHIVFSLLSYALLANVLWAQSSATGTATSLGETDSKLRGIKLQVDGVKRIPGDRLVFIVEVCATPDAPAGTQLGSIPSVPEVFPPGRSMSDYMPKPFSIAPAMMIEESTQTSYASVTPVPAGGNFVPSSVITYLRPNSSTYLTVQFPVPPPPQPVDGIVPKQTVSLLLNNARAPITKVVIPPPPAPAGAPAGTP